MKTLVKPLLKNGLLLSEGDYWKRQRALVNPAFHYTALQSMIPMMVDAANDMWVGTAFFRCSLYFFGFLFARSWCSFLL